MPPLRVLISVLTVAVLLGSGVTVVAQDATPEPGAASTAPNAGEPLPGQYTFYPSDVAVPAVISPETPGSSSSR
jgi:hypothetical protein